MHGSILVQLRKFAVEEVGADWEALCEKAGVRRKLYVGLGTYPDEDVVALVGAASAMTGLSGAEVLTRFGRFLAPALIHTYGSLLGAEWGALDLLENVEGTVHRTVRLRDANATPPALSAHRLGPDHLTIEYRSTRRLCALARGLIEAVGTHYSASLQIEETHCMHRDDDACVFDVLDVPS